MSADAVLSYLVALAIGALPWFLDKAGIQVPTWLVYGGLLVCVSVLAIMIAVLGARLLSQFQLVRARQIPLSLGLSAGVVGVLIVGVLLVAVFRLGAAYSSTDQSTWGAWETMPMRDVWNQTYKNETVTLDGKRFRQCSFDNVTMEYNGTAPVEFVDSRHTGNIKLVSTRNPSINMFLKLHRFLSEIPGARPSGSGVTPPAHLR